MSVLVHVAGWRGGMHDEHGFAGGPIGNMMPQWVAEIRLRSDSNRHSFVAVKKR